jgi:hypothetical protein
LIRQAEERSGLPIHWRNDSFCENSLDIPMGLFKRIKKAIGVKRSDDIREIETCVVDERMWNIFTKIPRRVVDGERIELVWITIDDSSWEEEILQYARLKDGAETAEIKDGSSRLFIGPDGFIYDGVYKCRQIIVPSWHCNEFGCKALVLSPEEAMKRLWYLYEKYKAKKIKSV